jgi:hypothetical protein
MPRVALARKAMVRQVELARQELELGPSNPVIIGQRRTAVESAVRPGNGPNTSFLYWSETKAPDPNKKTCVIWRRTKAPSTQCEDFFSVLLKQKLPQ